MAAPTDFLGRLSAADRRALLRLARRRSVDRGGYVFRVGSADPGVHLLLDGRLKFFRLSPAGREVILWFGYPGEVFGMSEVALGKGRRVNVQACEDCELAVVPDAAFNRFLERRLDASRACRSVMAARLGLLTNALVSLVADDARTRIAKLVLHLGARHGGTRGEGPWSLPRLTHQEIAGMAGVNRQTASRVLGELRREGLLKVEGRRIRIADARRLATGTRSA